MTSRTDRNRAQEQGWLGRSEDQAHPPAASREPRLPAGVVALWTGIMGAAPHVLHHIGPLAGIGLVAGAGGQALFGVAGFAATIPVLRRLRRRTGGLRAPALAFMAFAAIYSVSTLLVGPALADASAPDAGGPSEQVEVDHHGHDVPGA